MKKSLALITIGVLCLSIFQCQHLPSTVLAGAPGYTFYTSASDSYIYQYDDNYSQAWTSTTGIVVDYDPVLGVGQSSPSFGIGPAKYEVWRTFLYFDTTSLPTGLRIQKAVLTLYTADIGAINTNFNITVQNGQPTYPHDPNQATDFDKTKYSGIGGQLSTDGLAVGFNDVVLNPAGISWINSGGWTKFCLRSDRDINGIPPTNTERITILTSKYGDGSYRARLNIYASPLSASISPLSASILVGQSVTSTSTVSGGYAPYSYQWYLNDNPVSGATLNTWTFTPTTVGNYTVHLNVTDNLGNIAKSNDASVTVAAQLSASISPMSASLLIGTPVAFTSTVSGGYAPYSYQWYLDGNPVSGATSNSWTFTLTTSGVYYVYLKVTDTLGNIAQSETARIMITSVPVGGYSVSLTGHSTVMPSSVYLALVIMLSAVFATVRRRTRPRKS